MATFMEIKSINPGLEKYEIAKELGCGSSTSLQRYRQDVNMLSSYRTPPNSNKKGQKILNRKHDPERHQMTSNYIKRLQLGCPETVKPKKNKVEGGANIEINDKYVDEFLHNKNI